jgi:spore coat polysaccharide biosynthesis predicted glycosyltransferase SpsG
MYELAFLGVPSCSIVMANNQLPVAEAFALSGTSRYLGTRDTVVGSNVREAIMLLLDSVVLRKAMSDAGRMLVDGQGARRTAKYIEQKVKGR